MSVIRGMAVFGCRVSVKVGLNSTTTTWSLSAVPATARPESGTKRVHFRCPRCKKPFAISVESIATVKRKRTIFLIVGAVLTIAWVIVANMFLGYAGQTVDEAHPEAIMGPMKMLALPFFGLLILAPTLLCLWRLHQGFKNLRLVRGDGKETIWVQGHKL